MGFYIYRLISEKCGSVSEFVYFCKRNSFKKGMTTAVLERETNNYWELIKNLSVEVKLALIARLSSSLVYEAVRDDKEANRLIDEILQNAPADAPLTDEEIQQEINAVRYAV